LSDVLDTVERAVLTAGPPCRRANPDVTPVTWGMDATTTRLAEGNADDGMDT
jgi:hypothetical protein